MWENPERNNSRRKEKHGEMVSHKPIIKVVSIKNWWPAVLSKHNFEMCPSGWQLLHMEAPVSAVPDAGRE